MNAEKIMKLKKIITFEYCNVDLRLYLCRKKEKPEKSLKERVFYFFLLYPQQKIMNLKGSLSL